MQQDHISLHLSPVLNHIPIFGRGLVGFIMPSQLVICDFRSLIAFVYLLVFLLIFHSNFLCTTLRSLCITVDTIDLNRFHLLSVSEQGPLFIQLHQLLLKEISHKGFHYLHNALIYHYKIMPSTCMSISCEVMLILILPHNLYQCLKCFKSDNV